MKVAVYTRKSTDEKADSLDVQRASAQAFATSKGWTIVATFEDFGISRDEFVRRPGWFAMAAAAKRGAFEAVICRDLSRVGGHAARTSILVEDLSVAGAALWFYAEGREVPIKTAHDRLILGVSASQGDAEVERIRSRTGEALRKKATEGKCAGGGCYGYDVVPHPSGSGKAYRVNEEQAAIVREVFERYANGEGLGTIANALQARGIESPRAKGWDKSALHSWLRRPRYVGRLEYGVTRKVVRGGRARLREDAPVEGILRGHFPEWQIVGEDLFERVQKVIAANARPDRSASPPPGARRGGHPTTNLLSGVLRCGECGGPIRAGVRTRASYETIPAYVCSNYVRGRGGWGGRARCGNALRRPLAELNAKVIEWLRANVLREELIVATIKETRHRFAEQLAANAGDVPKLEKQAAKLRAERDRFVDLAARAPVGAEDAFFEKVRERSERLRDVEAQLATKAVARGGADLEFRRLEVDARRRLADLTTALLADGPRARSVLAAAFPKGITAFPVEVAAPGGGRPSKRWALEGDSVAIGPLLLVDDEGEGSLTVASPAGFEPA